MARLPRFVIPDQPQHVIVRGNNRSGTQIAALSSATVNPALAPQGGQAITPITQVALPAGVVRSGGINTQVPNNSLSTATPDPAAHYLIETDPVFADYRAWLSSDYLLDALALDPALTQKRLGDGFYEQKLIREQVAQLTGRRFLDGHASDEAQYATLMDNGATFARAWHLVPGIELTAAQMAHLTSDIVWLVEKTITLPDGSTTQALVPQLYARVQEGDLQSGGALMAGDNVNLDVTGDLRNGGTLGGRQAVSLTAANLHNLGGRILGDTVTVAANTDLNNLGGVIAANNNLVARAGRDLNIASTTRTQNNAQGSRTNRDRIAGLYVTGSTGELLASAGRDLTLTAAQVQSSGRAALGANHNLHLNTVQEAQNTTIVWDGANHRSDAGRAEAGTQIQTQGDLTLQAGNDLTAKAANVTSSQGSLAATAGNDLTLAAAQASIQLDEAHRHKGGGFLSKKTRATRDTLEQTTAQGTTLSGNRVSVVAGHDLTLTGSNVVSDRGTELAAQRDLTLEAATNATLETHFKAEKKSGLMGSGGIGFSIGTQQQSNDQKGAATLTAATTVGSTQGNIDLRAGKTYTQSGSDLLAPQGDIGVNAQRIDILEARETSQSRTETKFRQSGLTLALSSPVISAIQTVDQMRRAAKDTADPRMQALAAGAAGLAGYGAYKQVKAGQGTTLNGKDNQIATGKTNPDGTPETRDADLADKMGGVSVSISLGNSKSESHSTRTGDTARGSTLVTGGDVTLTAKAGKGEEEREKGDGDLTVVGSDIKAGRNVSLEADHKITLRAAQNSASQTSHNTSSSNSLGIGFALGGQSNGFTLNLAASRARGNADGDDVSYSNIRLEAGNQLTLKSGGDTALQGAVASGKQITAAIGGNLAIESLQDTSTYQSEQKSAGFSASIPIYGTGGSASVNLGKTNIDSDYASVTEQSGLRAGDAGFDVRVKGNTDLTGGAITSTQAAIDRHQNTLTTASLTTSDLQNKAEAHASSSGISLSSDMLTQGKYGIAKGVVGNALNNAGESGSSAGQTRSAVSEGAVNITDEAEQQQRTGKSGQETVASLNRDTAHAQTAAQKQDVEAMQRTVEAERAIKEETYKMVTTFTDEAYRSRFEQQPKPLKGECPAGANCIADPSKLIYSYATAEDIKNADPGSILAVNGILNDEKRAVELGYQNILPDKDTNEKPTTFYVMHIAPASNTLSELLGVAYEKIVASADYGLANFLGYTNGQELYAALLHSRGQQKTQSLGHSRGTLIQEAAFTILNNRPDEDGNLYTNPDLAVRGFAGAADAVVYSEKAMKIVNDPKKNENITYSYFSNDPVATSKLSGGNPGVWALKDLWQVFATNNSMHSCGGTGATGCTQVEKPVPGGPQGTPDGNAKLIEYVGGERVDNNPIGRDSQGGVK